VTDSNVVKGGARCRITEALDLTEETGKDAT